MQRESFAQLRIGGVSWLWSDTRTGRSQAVGSDGGRHLHVDEASCLWPAAMWTTESKEQDPESSNLVTAAKTASAWLRQQPAESVRVHQAHREAVHSHHC